MKQIILTMLLILVAGQVALANDMMATPLPQGGWSLSWDASPTAGVSYNIYRKDALCSSASGIFTKLNTTPVTDLNYTDTTAPSTKVCYVVRSVDADGIESDDSNRLSLPRPGPPTNLRKT